MSEVKTQNVEVAAGRLFCLSRGEYSDYGYSGHFLALRDITKSDMQEVVDACKAEATKRNREEDSFYDDDYGADDLFIPSLIHRGWVMDVDVREIHTGSYGRLELN